MDYKFPLVSSLLFWTEIFYVLILLDLLSLKDDGIVL